MLFQGGKRSISHLLFCLHDLIFVFTHPFLKHQDQNNVEGWTWSSRLQLGLIPWAFVGINSSGSREGESGLESQFHHSASWESTTLEKQKWQQQRDAVPPLGWESSCSLTTLYWQAVRLQVSPLGQCTTSLGGASLPLWWRRVASEGPCSAQAEGLSPSMAWGLARF